MTQAPAVSHDSSAPGALLELIEAAGAYARQDRAEATRRAYDGRWRHFEAWATSKGLPHAPTTGDVLALYLSAFAPTDAVSTLAQRMAAIRAVHSEAGWPAPDSPGLKRVWAGIRRAHGRPAAAKAALMLPELRRILDALPDTLAGKRDRALLLVGFGAALRRSELAGIELAGSDAPVTLAFVSEGLEIHIARAKGDQEGRGVVLGIPNGREPATCAAAAVRAWLEAADIKAGPIFRSVTRAGKLGAGAITPQVVALVVKAAAERAGLDPAALAGHSLRAGLITSAAVNDAAPDLLMAHARHARFDTTRKYIRAGQRFTRNAAAVAGL